MKRTLALLALVATLALGSTTGALAQYVMDVGSLTVALRVGDLGDSEEIDQATTFYVAKLSLIAGAKNSKVLDRAIANRIRAIRYLRNIVHQSREAMRILEINHSRLDQVILVTTTNDHTATLYVDDR